MIRKRLLLMVVGLIVASASAWADLVIEETVQPGGGMAPQTMRFFVTPTHLALVQGSSGMIFLADRQILWQYDTDQHLYLEFTPEAIKGLKAQSESMVSRAVEAMKQQMANASPGQKAAIEKAINEMQNGPTFSFRRLAGEKSVAGYRCVPVELLVDDQSADQMCAARISALGLTPADIQVFDKLSKFYAQLGKDTNLGSFDLPGLKKFLGYAAFPVQETSQGAEGTTVTTISSVKHETVAAARFQLPPGLTKQDLLGGN